MSEPHCQRSIVSDLLCPLTLELPIEPVVAEDGRVYERYAIQTHFETHASSGKPVKSPVTHETMGENLIAAIEIKNHIETLVETGVIFGDLAQTWRMGVQKEEEAVGLAKKAEAGDVLAMEWLVEHHVSKLFKRGTGLEEDRTAAHKWSEMAAAKGSLLGISAMGMLLATGVGVAENPAEGMLYIAYAAGKGTRISAFMLGRAYASGKWGLPRDIQKALHRFQTALACSSPSLEDGRFEKDVRNLMANLSCTDK